MEFVRNPCFCAALYLIVHRSTEKIASVCLCLPSTWLPLVIPYCTKSNVSNLGLESILTKT